MSDETRRPFRLIGRSTGGRTGAPPRDTAGELLAAVRAAALACTPPTLTTGDLLGPVGWRDRLTRLPVVEVHGSAYRLLGEAELALAGWVGRVPELTLAVVLYERAFNVVAFEPPLPLDLARRANDAASSGRFVTATPATDGHPPIICTLGSRGQIHTVARPSYRDEPDGPSSWLGPAAGSDERRTPLYLVTDPD